LFRRWLAYVTVISINSMLLLFFGWPWFANLVLRGTWLGEEAGIWFTMTLATALCTLWAWRRQLHFVSQGEDDVPPRTEKIVLIVLSVVFAATVLFYLVWMEPKRFQLDWNLVLVLSAGIWFATLVRVCRDYFNPQSLELPRSTEGLILGA